jgi:2-aminomuconate deaminase
MTSDASVTSDRAPEPVGAYPHAKRAGDFLFLSGVGPRRRGSDEIPGVTRDESGRVIAHDIADQCRSCFENVRVILEDAGAKWADIVDVTVFLTNMDRDFKAYNAIYAEHFAGDGMPNPTRTTVEVGALPTAIDVELKVIAVCNAP